MVVDLCAHHLHVCRDGHFQTQYLAALQNGNTSNRNNNNLLYNNNNNNLKIKSQYHYFQKKMYKLSRINEIIK